MAGFLSFLSSYRIPPPATTATDRIEIGVTRVQVPGKRNGVTFDNAAANYCAAFSVAWAEEADTQDRLFYYMG